METGHIQRGSSLTDNITMVANSVIRDNKMPALDFKVLCWFLSHDKSFVIKKIGLHKHFLEGRDAVSNAFKRLVEARFIIPIEVFNSGRFDGYNYMVYHSPITENQSMVISGKIRKNDSNNTSLNEIEPFTENPLTEDQYPFKKTNSKNNVESEKLPTSSLIEGNEKLLRHMPKTVRGKKVSDSEIQSIIEYTKQFNIVRDNYFMNIGESKNGVTPSNKSIRQLIDIIRDGHTVSNVIDAAYNAFEDKFHKENKYFYITMEYIVRDDIWQKYRDAD